MKYEEMPKGRNEDICVKCGKRYNSADKALYELHHGGLQPPAYDLLCMAESVIGGYTTHGNVKLCGECMTELMGWLEDAVPLDAEWKDYGDGIYCCTRCGMPSGWGHPSIHAQSLGRYCGSCGAKMKNEAVGNRTPRESVRAYWIHKEKNSHQYFCSVCGGKESGPRIWCPRCGTHMDDGAWSKRWAVQEA